MAHPGVTIEESDAVPEPTMPALEMFFDLSSPWTYLAFTNLYGVIDGPAHRCAIAPDPGRRRVQCRQPGGLCRARTDGQSPSMRHSWKVLKDWAALAGRRDELPVAMASGQERQCDALGCALADDHARADRLHARGVCRAISARRKISMIRRCWSRWRIASGLDGAALREAAQQRCGQGAAARQYRRTHRARRLWLADDSSLMAPTCISAMISFRLSRRR